MMKSQHHLRTALIATLLPLLLGAQNAPRRANDNTPEQLGDLLADRPSSLLANYAEPGHRFGRTAPAQPTGRTVILVHGWGVRASSMQELADALAEQGYDTYNYDYPTSRDDIPAITSRFTHNLRRLLAALPREERIYLLTHSMGGLLLRGALVQLTVEECRRICAIVMLGPPNQGSFWGRLGNLPLVGAVNPALGDMSPDAASYVMNIPPPAMMPPVGIIAGKYDGKVSLDSTALPAPLPYQRTVVNCTHPGLRRPEKVLKHILDFFHHYRF